MAADKMILAENVMVSTDCEKTGLNNNVIVCGGSGTGKTLSFLEPCLLETFESSVIVTVVKRRVVDQYKPMFRKRGYVVEDMNFAYPERSTVTFDPLKYVKSYTDIRFLAQSIVKANPRKDRSNADPYWDEAAISLLSALIAYTMMTKRDGTFADVLDLLNELSFTGESGQIETTLDRKFDSLAKQDPKCFAVSCWRSFRLLPVRTAGSVFGTLNTTIDTIFSPELCRMIARNKNVDFEKLASSKTALFITASAVNPALHSFISMFYAQAFKQLFEFAEKQPSGQLPLPVRMLYDDFAVGGRVMNCAEYMSILREKRISMCLLIQSESQLASMYSREDATTIINNCDTYIFFGSMDLTTARHISERINLPLEDVLYMPVNQVYVFRRGQKPITAKRYDIYRDEVYQAVMKMQKRSRAIREK
ncbi:MAG: type IV secretory system conjugative DNA transfer family protein [Lachnospiraceae bacterium]|nr:type IV secretory system conjugative DNA transfer family protein [Lachnospiraceae bacterium]